ncbi:1-acyl-sn-glycerol-3-phosphate acyltransferase [Williamsia sp. DF01-3]|uniref:1-acyl-sn-glycerol-3-phosphate acyltransferase n=1 Tax=Williamsia sp. DF01-3 TaxID=2934157 RepID=UPI001FF63369|nr:1-acyl-sn-glycerol-3-phosphate acyltransferase [Williamsia sp. DF01-3]MCK0516459.1 1-acyl-sn-glycerol-3-phosphate acyltransferase [Williamsia sp. DF01-3]
MDIVPRHLVKLTVGVARRYHRMEVDQRCHTPKGPVLFVANHGFGGVFDLNLLAFAAAYQQVGDRRRVSVLTHAIAWKLGVGRLVNMFDGIPADHDTALRALDSGDHVLVFPGGDIDGFKSWQDRNKIMFDGRTGFARLAIDAGVPIVPVVTAGAGESLFVLSSGRGAARRLGLDRVLRLKTFPVSFSAPWGFNVGLVGLLPYLPLPTKITTTVLPAMQAEEGETAEDFGRRVHAVMDRKLSAMTAKRIPLLG